MSVLRRITRKKMLHEKPKMGLHGIYKGILNGIHHRGDGGFLYVRKNEVAYVFLHELKNQHDLRNGLQELLQDDNAKLVYYVVEEKDGACHVLAYPRVVVEQAVVDDVRQNQSVHVNGADCFTQDKQAPV